jgi:hypothetical protein
VSKLSVNNCVELLNVMVGGDVPMRGVEHGIGLLNPAPSLDMYSSVTVPLATGGMPIGGVTDVNL